MSLEERAELSCGCFWLKRGPPLHTASSHILVWFWFVLYQRLQELRFRVEAFEEKSRQFCQPPWKGGTMIRDRQDTTQLTRVAALCCGIQSPPQSVIICSLKLRKLALLERPLVMKEATEVAVVCNAHPQA